MFDVADPWYRQMTMSSAVLPPAPERPIYTVAEAARYSNTSAETARRWVRGYDYKTLRGEKRGPAVGFHLPGERFLTFWDLVEVAAISAAIRAGVPLQRIRKAIDYARERFQNDRPLLLEKFLTDGRSLWLKELGPRADPLHVNASEAGQLAFPHIAEVLQHLDYQDERPARWWPVGRDRPIVVDPDIGFGQPTIYPAGIRIATLNDRFYAGEDPESIAADYGIRTQDVLDAIRFETRPAVVVS